MTALKYEIKTHRLGRTYNNPHFYILNKGLNSGRSEEQRESLFYLCLSLLTGRYFNYYIKGSVIPFITINDTRKVLNTASQNYEKDQWQLKVSKLMKITAYENNLKDQLNTIAQLKLALLRT